MNILLLSIASALMTYPAGALNVKATGGTTDINLSDRFASCLHLKDFGAKGDGVTDDSAAWQAAVTAANTIIDSAVSPHTPRSTVALYIDPGKYVINTGATVWDCRLKLVGDKNSVNFVIGAGQVLLTVQGYVYSFDCVGAVKTTGGKGVFNFTRTLANVCNGLNICENEFFDYTGCAVGSLANDFPYQKICGNVFYGTSTSIGFAAAGDITRSRIQGNKFLLNGYHIKCFASNMLIADNDFLRANTSSGGQTDIWFVPTTAQSSTNQECVVAFNKFGNEGFNVNDYRVLVALEGSGTNFLDKPHTTTTSSSYYSYGLRMMRNEHLDVGSITYGPVYSNVKGVERFVFEDVPCSQYPYILHFNPAIDFTADDYPNTTNMVVITGFPGDMLGSGYPQITNGKRISVVDPYCLAAGQDGIPSATPVGKSPFWQNVLTTNAMTAFTATSCTTAAITDSRGGTNAATVTCSASNATFSKQLPIANLIPGQLAWIEVELRKSSTNPLSQAYVRIRDNSFAALFGRKIRLGSQWTTIRFPWTPNRNSSNLSLSVDPGDYVAGTAVNFDIGIPRIYHATAPVNIDTLSFQNSVTWDPASIANGASATTTVTVTNAVVGDFVVAAFSNSLSGLTLTGYVSATNTVTAVLSNTTGGAVDLASGTLTCKVFKNL